MSSGARHSKSQFGRTLAVAVAFVIVVVGLLLWLAGVFHPKIGGHAAADAPADRSLSADAEVAPVRLIRTPEVESAVGAIRAVHETAVASKLLAKVVAVNIAAGRQVEKGEVLVQLDDADLSARLEQARAALESAAAARDQAQIEYQRVASLHEDGRASQLEYDRAKAADRAAQAEFDKARQAVREAETMLAYATIRATMDGIIIEKKVEVGDTATPGQVVATLYDPTRMQLVAQVREALASRLSVGQKLSLDVEALHKTCHGTVSEIVPEAQTASRTFSVKVTGPCPDGVFSGMFGRLHIPVGEREMLVIPVEAVRRVGQLDLVDVVQEGPAGRVAQRRAVQLGRTVDGAVQVLSGLRLGEQVVVSDIDQA